MALFVLVSLVLIITGVALQGDFEESSNSSSRSRDSIELGDDPIVQRAAAELSGIVIHYYRLFRICKEANRVIENKASGFSWGLNSGNL